MLEILPPVKSDLNIRKVSREALSEQVIEQLQQLVIDRHLKIGDQLPGERELCEQFGVSRTVIREATRILAQRGILTIEPGRGTFVTLPNQQNIALSIELFARANNMSISSVVEVRKALEPQIAALAAMRARPEHLERLQECIDEMEAHIQEPQGYIAADQEYHSTLAEATGNSLFTALTGVIVNLAQATRMRMFEVEGAPDRGQVYHRLIFNYVSEGNAEAARKAMIDHLDQIDRDVAEAQARRGDGPKTVGGLI